MLACLLLLKLGSCVIFIIVAILTIVHAPSGVAIWDVWTQVKQCITQQAVWRVPKKLQFYKHNFKCSSLNSTESKWVILANWIVFMWVALYLLCGLTGEVVARVSVSKVSMSHSCDTGWKIATLSFNSVHPVLPSLLVGTACSSR